MPPVPVPIEHVEQLVHRWFPQGSVTVERMESGGSTPVYRLTSRGETTYLRLAEEPGEERKGEVAAHSLALAVGVSVPAILRFEAAPHELDRSATLTAAMPGIPLTELNGPIPDATINAIATDLARFNALPVQGYGWIDGVTPEGRLYAEHSTRSAWVREYRSAAATVEAAKILPEAVAVTLSAAIREWSDRPDRQPACLAHGDFDPSHIYVDPVDGTYQGLIDLGEIRGTDPLYDLGHLLAHAFDQDSEELTTRIIGASSLIRPIDGKELRLQAIAIVTRALAIQLTRPPNAYTTNLTRLLKSLLTVA